MSIHCSKHDTQRHKVCMYSLHEYYSVVHQQYSFNHRLKGGIRQDISYISGRLQFSTVRYLCCKRLKYRLLMSMLSGNRLYKLDS